MLKVNLEPKQALVEEDMYPGIDVATRTCIELDSIDDMIIEMSALPGFDSTRKALEVAYTQKFVTAMNYVMEDLEMDDIDDNMSESERSRRTLGISRMMDAIRKPLNRNFLLFTKSKNHLLANVKKNAPKGLKTQITKLITELSTNLSKFKDIINSMITIRKRSNMFIWEFVKFWWSLNMGLFLGIIFFPNLIGIILGVALTISIYKADAIGGSTKGNKADLISDNAEYCFEAITEGVRDIADDDDFDMIKDKLQSYVHSSNKIISKAKDYKGRMDAKMSTF